ncbi:hypothetical protein GGF43_006846, partial [Coemansia sp. RSA 2618]
AALLDASAHAELVASARKLLIAFAQLATQSPDDSVARALIQALSQQARDVVFEEGYAEKFSARLERAGSAGDAVQLVLSKAQHVAQDTGDIAQAAQSIDAYAAELLREAGGAKALATATELLAALPGSEVAQTVGWSGARLPRVDAALLGLLPAHLALDVELTEANAPVAALVRLYRQVLFLHFAGSQLFSAAAIGRVFAWTEHVFTLVYHAQWAPLGIDEAALNAWIRASHEVLGAWIMLARDERAGALFVRYWLERSGGHGQSALGLLFDFAVTKANAGGDSDDVQGHSSSSSSSSSAALIASKLAAQARRAWTATEAQLAQLSLGAQLARALGESIVQDIDSLRSEKSA